jgi:pyruvate dehydrogenase E2 component (dihydrolipoamide acetyltransferase)
MTEGVIIEWKVEPGQAFRKGDVLVVIETEKVSYEVEAESEGVMVEIQVSAGKNVPVGDPIARWRVTETACEDKGASNPPEEETSRLHVGMSAIEGAHSIIIPSTGSPPVQPSLRIVATPLARRLAHQLRVELATVKGSGPSGRIRAEDVKAATAQLDIHSGPSTGAGTDRVSPIDVGIRTPADRVHVAMARRLTAVKQEVPHFYLSSEAEVSALLTMRNSLNADAGLARITINHVVLAAVGRTLLDLPHANKVWANGNLITYGSTDVGLAVHTSRGLFVPILRDTGLFNLDGVASQAIRLVAKTQEGRLLPEDMSGGTITVSNAGMFNVSYLTPIINPGHSAILGVGSLRQLFRPDNEGKPSLRQEIGLVLACDHRVFDGVAGLEILNRIIFHLENPFRLLRNPSEHQ